MKPHMEKKPKKYVNVGRSVEEVILRRKFDSTNPTTWPDPLKTSVKSNALPNIPEPVVAKPNAYLSDYPEDDKQKMMDTLMSYCRALQNKVEVCETIRFVSFVTAASRIWKVNYCPPITVWLG